jgi:SAM-dependent methyltransferase
MAATDILSHPFVYMAYQAVIGGIRARRLCMERVVRPGRGLSVLDIGCGPGYGIQYFDQPDYHGYDVSEPYIRWARRMYPKGKFHALEFNEQALATSPRMDVVLMMGLLHHLNDAEAVSLFQLVSRVLKPGGRVVTLDGCYVPGQSRLAKWFLDGDRGKFVRDEAGYVSLARHAFHQVQSSIHDDFFRIPYSTIILQCSQPNA